MRVLHTADWHLGRRLNRVDRLDEQAQWLEGLVQRTRELDPHVVVVSGDVFDVFTPSAGAERLYYRTLRGLSDGGRRAVLVVAGNHDSGSRLVAPREVLEDLGVVVAGLPHAETALPETRSFEGFSIAESGPGWVVLSFPDQDPVRFHLLPFPSRSRLPTHHQDPQRSITETVRALHDELPPFDGPTFLTSHLYVGTGAVEEDRDDFVGGAYAVDPEALAPYDAAFLGHLHRPHGRDNWRYAGSPLRFDFDDPQVDRGCWLWEGGAWRFEALPEQRDLVEVTVADVDEALARAEEAPSAWVRLRFAAGNVLPPRERERVKEAYGSRLVDIQFELPDEGPERPVLPDLGRVDPEPAFRSFFEQQQDGAQPPPELVDLFLELLNEEGTA